MIENLEEWCVNLPNDRVHSIDENFLRARENLLWRTKTNAGMRCAIAQLQQSRNSAAIIAGMPLIRTLLKLPAIADTQAVLEFRI